MIILITGTSSGIGLSLAEFFGKRGHKVYGFSRTLTPNELFISKSVDVTDPIQVREAVAEVISVEKRIDVLLNNAGMGMVGAVEDATPEEISRLFNLNLTAPVLLMKEVFPHMREQKSGKVINVSSIASEMGLPFRGFYSASKAALDKVTEAARYEVLEWNIQVTALHLGDIQTKIAENRIRTQVSNPYTEVFNKVYGLMNSHVDAGTPPEEVAGYIEKLLQNDQLKAHYYFGKTGQKLGVTLKKILPQNVFEKLMRKYNGLN